MIKAQAVRAVEGVVGVDVGRTGVQRVGLLDGRVARQHEEIPGERGCGDVPSGLDHLDDLSVPVARSRVGCISQGSAGIVGHGAVDIAGGLVDGEPFGTVHLGGAHGVASQTRVDQDLSQ